MTTKTKKTIFKTAKARQVWKRLKNHSRQNVMNHLQKKVGLSKAGASTYYNNLRKEFAN